jgi:hypothetical protein
VRKKEPRLSLRALLDLQEGRAAGVAQDIDSIKYMVRAIQWRVDAVVNHLKVPVQPDALEEIVNPSASFINKVVMEARFAGAAAPKVKRAAKKKTKRRSKKKS